MAKTLSPEIEKKLIEYRNQWYNNSTSVDYKNNADEIQKAIFEAYKLLELKSPDYFISLQSPYEGMLALAIFTFFHYNQEVAFAEHSWNQVWESRLSIVRSVKSFQYYHFMKKILKIHKYNKPIDFEESAGAIEFKTIDRLELLASEDMDDGTRVQLKKDIYLKLEDYIEDDWKNMFNKLIQILPNSFTGRKIGRYIGNGYGTMEEIVLCRLKYYYEVLNIERYAILKPFYDLQICSGWWWAFKNLVISTPKPIEINFDQDNNLHAVGKKAIKFSDNTGLFRVHGVEIPEEWAICKKENWKSSWLLSSNNAEHRMALIKVLGYEKIMSDLQSLLIHESIDDFGNTMELRKIKNDVDLEPIVLLKVICPTTKKTHVLRVPPDMKDCETARRWTFFDSAHKMNFTLET